MPGILPMKVIKVGTTSQARIAQACDRCRSKKIRCDGLTPTCTQCANVGFECKTSDKLSRRAFPRGYTESLEDRVRALELEVKELKELLDTKDEKIDMLSKIHAQSPSPARRASLGLAQASNNGRCGSAQSDRNDIFKLHQPPTLLRRADSDAVFMGNSSGRVFIDAFVRKLQEAGKSCPDFDSSSFFPSSTTAQKATLATLKESKLWRPPPRVMSDQLVNIYFQEWAPLFPVLHRPTFLELYERYVSNPASVTDKCSLAQLSLVFGIAAASSETRTSYPIDLFEKQWFTAMESFMLDTTIKTLQCLILAQLFCIQRGDNTKLLHYKGLAVGIAQRLGLHLSQKRFVFGALTVETRKKVFWTLYTLDCFTSAVLGLPKMIREADLHCEYPVDSDDEYITEEGFKPTLPGEFTKLCSALALFRGSRILGKVLEENYSAATSHDFSLRDISALDEELRAWQDGLPSHLRMTFVHDKPSVQVMNSRCPLLCLTYHYIQTLIHRPVVCANLGEKASSSIVALASSSKCVLQILQLLQERNLTFSFCLNKDELLTVSGFGILFQALDLEKDSKLMKDNGKSFHIVANLLKRRSAPGAAEFARIGSSALAISKPQEPQEANRRLADVVDVSIQTQKQLQALAARYNVAAVEQKQKKSTTSTNTKSFNSLFVTVPHTIVKPENISPQPMAPPIHRPSLLSPPLSTSSADVSKRRSSYEPTNTPSGVTTSTPNLDYFPLMTSQGLDHLDKHVTDGRGIIWENVSPGLDNSYINDHSVGMFNAIPTEPFMQPHASYQSSVQPLGAEERSWVINAYDYGLSSMDYSSLPTGQSLIAYTEDSLGNSEDFSSCDLTSTNSDVEYRGLIVSEYSPDTLSSLGETSDYGTIHMQLLGYE